MVTCAGSLAVLQHLHRAFPNEAKAV
jgi:hypothetical protein